MSIRLTDLTRRYDGRPAVDRLSVDVPSEAFFVVLGPSGCGKSTLLRLIAGLEAPDAGRIALAGRDMSAPGLMVPPEARGVAVVFQSYALWPHMTVTDNVAFPLEASGLPRAKARIAAQNHLEAVALAGLGARRPVDLSGGQRQRVALARCLAGQAKVVLMDEPLANLDPHLRAAMEDEMVQFHRRAGATTLYITHDQREAMALADVVAIMRDGRFEQVGPPAEVHDRPASAFVASFVGRGGVVPVTVVSAAGGQAQVVLPDGATATVLAGPEPREGAGHVLLRPADLRPDPSGQPYRIVSAAYRGEHWEAKAVPTAAPQTPPVTLSLTRPIRQGDILPVLAVSGWLLPAAAPRT